MTPEQALQILDSATATAHMTRADHIRAQQAVEIIAAALKLLEDYKSKDF